MCVIPVTGPVTFSLLLSFLGLLSIHRTFLGSRKKKWWSPFTSSKAKSENLDRWEREGKPHFCLFHALFKLCHVLCSLLLHRLISFHSFFLSLFLLLYAISLPRPWELGAPLSPHFSLSFFKIFPRVQRTRDARGKRSFERVALSVSTLPSVSLSSFNLPPHLLVFLGQVFSGQWQKQTDSVRWTITESG